MCLLFRVGLGVVRDFGGLNMGESIITKDGKEYGECSECGKSGRIFTCFYCEEGPFCWDCLQEHKQDEHRIY